MQAEWGWFRRQRLMKLFRYEHVASDEWNRSRFVNAEAEDTEVI